MTNLTPYGDRPSERDRVWSERELEFFRVKHITLDHIANYTVKQYGDKPHDEVEAWTPEQCVLAIQKYTKRFSTGSRGRLETLRDMIKIIHFATIAFWKLAPTKEEIEKIRGGKV